METKYTPRQIARDCINLKITEDIAVERIEELIQAVRDELTGTMGETERKEFTGIIKEYYKDYGYPIRGAANDIKEYLNAALKKCGFEKLEEVQNTKKNRSDIKSALYDLRNHFLG